MGRRRFLALGALLAMPHIASGADYPPVRPGVTLQFPRDLGSHPQFRTEWWYITGWVRDTTGHDYGIQVTFFRNRPNVAEGNPSRFAPRQLLFAHAAIADPRLGRLRHDQVAARAGFGLANAAEGTVDIAIGGWTLKLVGDTYVAHIEADEFAMDLAFATTQPPMLEGDRGLSRKGREVVNASYYYSLPHLRASGTLSMPGGVARVEGSAWFDHEWSSEAMAEDASGWDWTGINFDDGSALMAFRMRDRTGGPLWADATLRSADGRSREFAPDEISFVPLRRWRSPRTDVDYPVAMRVSVGGVEYALEPLLDDQELDSRASTGTIYWEGAVRVSAAGREVGRGYLELTGYFKALKL